MQNSGSYCCQKADGTGRPGKQLTERKGEAWPREEGGEAGPRGCKGLQAVGNPCSHPSIHLFIQYRWSQELVRCGFKSGLCYLLTTDKSLGFSISVFSPAEWDNTATEHIWSLPSQSGHSAWHRVMPSDS